MPLWILPIYRLTKQGLKKELLGEGVGEGVEREVGVSSCKLLYTLGTPLGLVHWKRASSPVEAGTAGYL